MNQENFYFGWDDVLVAFALPVVVLIALYLLAFGIAVVLLFHLGRSVPSYCIPGRDKPNTCVDIVKSS